MARYRLHDLLRLDARERLDKEPEPAQQAALERLLRAYHNSVDLAFQKLNPNNPMRTGPLLAPAGSVDDAVVDDAALDDPMRWFTLELPTLRALVDQAYEANLWGMTSRLGSSLFYFLEIGSFRSEWRLVDTRALEAARQGGHQAEEARALRNLGRLELVIALERWEWQLDGGSDLRAWSVAAEDTEAGGFERAIQLLEESRSLYQQRSDRVREAVTLRELADAYTGMDRLDEAVSGYLQAAAVFEETRFPSGIGSILAALGRAYRLQGEYEKAWRCLKEAVRYGRGELLPKPHYRLLAFALRHLGDLHREQKKLPVALEYYRESLGVFERIRDQRMHARTLSVYGQVLKQLARPAEARDCLVAAVAICEMLALPELADVSRWLDETG